MNSIDFDIELRLINSGAIIINELFLPLLLQSGVALS
jgi:hypothetical protein